MASKERISASIDPEVEEWLDDLDNKSAVVNEALRERMTAGQKTAEERIQEQVEEERAEIDALYREIEEREERIDRLEEKLESMQDEREERAEDLVEWVDGILHLSNEQRARRAKSDNPAGIYGEDAAAMVSEIVPDRDTLAERDGIREQLEEAGVVDNTGGWGSAVDWKLGGVNYADILTLRDGEREEVREWFEEYTGGDE